MLNINFPKRKRRELNNRELEMMKLKNLSNLCFPIKDMFTKLISFKLHYPNESIYDSRTNMMMMILPFMYM
jgi:hypothetical protein